MLHPDSDVATPGLAGSTQSAAEADIMRFIAILALCLMVLFSVDQSFRRTAEPPAERIASLPDPPSAPLEIPAPPLTLSVPKIAAPAASDPASAAPSSARPMDVDPARLHAATQPESLPNAPSGSVDSGHSAEPALYFDSDVAFLSLLTQGRIQVFLKSSETWSRVGLTRIEVVAAPGAPLYRLRPATVPELLRRQVPPDALALTAEWLVRLDEYIATQITRLLAGPPPPALVIGRTGQVRTASVREEEEEKQSHDQELPQ